MRASHVGLALLIAIGLGIFVRSRSTPPKEQSLQTLSEEAAPPSSSTGAYSVTPSNKPLVTPTNSATPEASQPRAARLEFPTLREVREQISQDPHRTPPALIAFAKALGAAAEDAKKSQASAVEFFGVLENCLESPKDPTEAVPTPAQLACLTTAEEFAKLYPNELASRLKPLQQNASPELKRVREALDRF